MTRPPLKSRIRFEQPPFNEATVISHTARGFTYEFDAPISFGRAAWGQQQTGGEIFVDVDFYDWTKHVTIIETDFTI